MGRRRRNQNHRYPVLEESGILLIDKPTEWSSFDCVNFVRSRFNIPKVGHCGTLDPAATGLLVLVLNKFTKKSADLSGEDKTYEATLLIGKESDSLDLDGKITAVNDYSDVTQESLTEAINSFVGEYEQIPPMVSALKKGGKKLCDLARKGIEVEREARLISINNIDIHSIDIPEAEFTVSCSKGTYIRSLCADIGAKLGCGGLLAKLRRIQSGNFSIEKAVKMDEIKAMEQADLIAKVVEDTKFYGLNDNNE
ncbi:tRNA pseudouridine(55) synthase TruB [Lentisphaerota bacterium WC36G]|nr:tRNA pseudouridine(55) synthase TruB [Lentisphaerae bacterium WC36]